MTAAASIVRTFEGGPRARSVVDGPEHSLVTEFLARVSAAFIPPRGCANTIFLEPALESGFPDVVLVTWHVRTANSLASRLDKIDAESLRVLHLLATKAAPTEFLEELMGPRKFERILSALYDRQLVYRRDGDWRTRSVDKLCAVRDIVAFEAKVGQVSGALQQASANRWFASHSYALFARRGPAERAVNRATQLGIGVWVGEDDAPISSAERTGAQPLSYASWLFSAWVARHAFYL